MKCVEAWSSNTRSADACTLRRRKNSCAKRRSSADSFSSAPKSPKALMRSTLLVARMPWSTAIAFTPRSVAASHTSSHSSHASLLDPSHLKTSQEVQGHWFAGGIFSQRSYRDGYSFGFLDYVVPKPLYQGGVSAYATAVQENGEVPQLAAILGVMHHVPDAAPPRGERSEVLVFPGHHAPVAEVKPVGGQILVHSAGQRAEVLLCPRSAVSIFHYDSIVLVAPKHLLPPSVRAKPQPGEGTARGGESFGTQGFSLQMQHLFHDGIVEVGENLGHAPSVHISQEEFVYETIDIRAQPAQLIHAGGLAYLVGDDPCFITLKTEEVAHGEHPGQLSVFPHHNQPAAPIFHHQEGRFVNELARVHGDRW